MKLTKDGRIFTHKPWHECIVRIPAEDLSLWVSAAAKRGVSRAEFMREALRKEAVRTLSNEGHEAR